MAEEEIELLIENSAALQSVLTDVAAELKALSSQISELLALFKEASKSIADEKASEEVERTEIKSLDEKIGGLMEQNKTVAKGILLMETAMREIMEKKNPSPF